MADDGTDAYEEMLRQYAPEAQGHGDFSSFLPLPPLHRPAELRNVGPRPGDVTAPVAETLSPTMGAYGFGALAGDTYLKGREGDVAGVASNLPGLLLAAAPIPGAKRAPVRIPNPARIRAWHGSPRDFDKFVTPAFFADTPGIAQIYRKEGGGYDNLNGLGSRVETPSGWYQAHEALDLAQQNKAKAIDLLIEKIRGLAPATLAPHYQQHYQQRGLLDVLLGRPARLDPQFEAWAKDYAAQQQAAIDFLGSGAPLGKIYEAELPKPTAHYYGNQKQDIADAIANGHKVITWGNARGPTPGDEIIALDPNVIDILRKYAMPPAIAAPALATALQQYGSGSDQ